MAEKKWRIDGYAGGEPTYDRTVPFESFSEPEIVALLRCLASRHLDEDEVIRSSLPENADGHLPHLEVKPHTGRIQGFYTTGAQHYSAKIENGE